MITKILEESFKEREEKVKRSFYPTDCTKNVFDLYHAFKGTPQTNPPDAEKLNMFRVAKLVEESLVQSFGDAGVLHATQMRVEMWRCGVYITGYADAVLLEEVLEGREKEGEIYIDEGGKELPPWKSSPKI